MHKTRSVALGRATSHQDVRGIPGHTPPVSPCVSPGAIRLPESPREMWWCPSTPVMERIPTWEQVLDFAQLIQECSRDAGEQQCVGRPDMIGHTCRHCGSHRTPLAWRTDPSCGFRRRQECLESPVGKHQRIIGQRHPPLLLKPPEVLGEGMRATGQAPVTLALRAIIAFDTARVQVLSQFLFEAL